MYRLKPEAAQWSGPAGVPWQDMADEEYQAVSAVYDKQFPDQPGSLKRWFEHIPDKRPKPAATAVSAASEGESEAG